jgi:8-oxo-dGTP diphosphatase
MATREHRPPGGYRVTDYPTFAVTVDNVILTMVDGRLHVLLVRRKEDPYSGCWALPGGFKRPDESLNQAAARELEEETGVAAPARLMQLGAYGDPGRDPRTNVVTVAYLAVTPDISDVNAGSDAADARVWPVAEVLGSLELAFDHSVILADAIERAAAQLEQTDLAIAFMGPTFSLSELQSVYEELWGIDFDDANFQRSIRGASRDSNGARAYIESTGLHGVSRPKGGRPPELYQAGPAWIDGPPIRRPKASGSTEGR